jgi:hypothetical protein
MGLDTVELVIAIETAFGIDIPDSDAKALATVGRLYDYVGRRIAPDLISPSGGPYAGALWERLLDVIEKDTGRERERLRPGARFIHDLGLE